MRVLAGSTRDRELVCGTELSRHGNHDTVDAKSCATKSRQPGRRNRYSRVVRTIAH